MSVDRLYRAAALSGLLSALVLVSNAGRRARLLPNAAPLHGIAPLAETFGLLALTGLYLRHRQSGGALGLAGYATSFVGLSGLLGAEFVINLIFPAIGTARANVLLHGLTGTVFLVAAVLFLVGTVGFGAALWRDHVLPRTATAAYMVGGVVISLRNVVPVGALVGGLLVAALGIGWLSVALARPATPSVS
ncbi:MAG TPA: hypothetical protein VF892_22565 [Pseudonocardiaceae bacterium]